jgi:hypothetical protein
LHVWLDLQKTGYGFGYGSLWSLAVLALLPAVPSPFALASTAGASALDGALANIVHNI